MSLRRTKAEPEPVAPNTVRVWRGFINPGTDYSKFADFLGQVFVPGCALLQPNAGLRAYVPSMTSQTNKPAAVPDQTALMWWATTTAHDEATKTPAVRIYQSLHSDAYNMSISKSDVPNLFAGTLTTDQSYYFFKNKADWMLGTVRHLVGAPKSPANFLQTLQTWAAAYQAKPPKGVDGALILAGANNSYVAFWEHWTGKAKSSPLDELAKTVTPYLNATAENIPPGGGLWSNWPGWDLTKHTCMNVQLDRPAEGRSSVPRVLGSSGGSRPEKPSARPRNRGPEDPRR